MSIRATVDGQNYNGIKTINAGGKSITLSEQGTITTPTASKTIDANGTYDVTNFAQAVVNVPTGGGTSSGDKTYDITLSSWKGATSGIDSPVPLTSESDFILVASSDTTDSGNLIGVLVQIHENGKIVVIRKIRDSAVVESKSDAPAINDSGKIINPISNNGFGTGSYKLIVL